MWEPPGNNVFWSVHGHISHIKISMLALYPIGTILGNMRLVCWEMCRNRAKACLEACMANSSHLANLACFDGLLHRANQEFNSPTVPCNKVRWSSPSLSFTGCSALVNSAEYFVTCRAIPGPFLIIPPQFLRSLVPLLGPPPPHAQLGMIPSSPATTVRPAN